MLKCFCPSLSFSRLHSQTVTFFKCPLLPKQPPPQKKQPHKQMSTELHCCFISVSSHNSLPLFFPLSVSVTSVPHKLVRSQCVVFKQIAVPSGDVLTFISRSYNKTPGEPHWCLHAGPDNMRAPFGNGALGSSVRATASAALSHPLPCWECVLADARVCG